MTLTIGSYVAGNARIQMADLRPVIGAHRLLVVLPITVNAARGQPHTASIIGVRVDVCVVGKTPSLGFARPESPLEIATKPVSTTLPPTLALPLQPAQLAALETPLPFRPLACQRKRQSQQP